MPSVVKPPQSFFSSAQSSASLAMSHCPGAGRQGTEPREAGEICGGERGQLWAVTTGSAAGGRACGCRASTHRTGRGRSSCRRWWSVWGRRYGHPGLGSLQQRAGCFVSVWHAVVEGGEVGSNLGSNLGRGGGRVNPTHPTLAWPRTTRFGLGRREGLTRGEHIAPSASFHSAHWHSAHWHRASRALMIGSRRHVCASSTAMCQLRQGGQSGAQTHPEAACVLPGSPGWCR